MDVNDLRIAVTVLSFACFGGIVAWAWARKNQSRFNEAALLPFAENQPRAAAPGRPKQGPTLSAGGESS